MNPVEAKGATLKTYYVYIMASASRTLYTGVTNNLDRRVLQHRRKLLPGFTSHYNINRLVHFEVFSEIRDAITREKQIKSWRRIKKITLIESMNRDWNALSDDWYGPQGKAQTPRQAEPDSSPGSE
jgi:putative endonuclease